jgi:hypothetical protein
MIAHVHLSFVVNANRDTKKYPNPITLPAPWIAEEKAEEVTPEERAELRARLVQHSAFRD